MSVYLSLQDFDLCVQCYEKDGHPHKMEKLGLDLDDGSSPSDQKQDNPQARTFQSLLMYYILISYHELNAYIECKRLAVHHTLYVPLASSSASYLLTPWSRVLLEKLTGSAASQEIPRIFGTRRFITVLTSARHLSLS